MSESERHPDISQTSDQAATELCGYRLQPSVPTIVPANVRREWMEQTSDRFATRCRRPGTTGRRAMNQCPCGNAGEPTRVCTCSEAEILRYRSRLSGPLADRIDMHVTLGAVSPSSLQQPSDGESSVSIRSRVEASRAIESLRLSARVYHRVLRVARTIADLMGNERVDASHVSEALRYRPR